MNLGDPELELVDPTPNIHSLFLHFDKVFFWARLASRAVVRWSKRMYSCAGICSYDRGGLCDIALSEPLLKLRPRKDLVETLLHEMIHAYLFITNRDCDRDGHGPNFKAHMHRINQAAGLNISIYHNFHDEVKLYQTHWWRCNGPCQTKKPHFGIVRRTNNRAPGPNDYWWEDHKRKCGGNFIKIKEPQKENKKQDKKRASPKPCGDITKYINNNNTNKEVAKPILKEPNKVPDKINSVKNSNSTIIVSKRNNIVFHPQVTKSNVFGGKGEVIMAQRNSTDSTNVTETVRNVWANKTIPPIFPNSKKNINNNRITNQDSPKSNKHKADSILSNTPPPKVNKIDDYFKSTSILKEIYGTDFKIKQDNKKKRLSIVSVDSDLVDCPICGGKVSSGVINTHLDECLNKDAIKNICKELPIVKSEIVNEEIVVIPKIKTENNSEKNIKDYILNNNDNFKDANIKTDPDKLLIPKQEKVDNKYEIPNVKIEPGTSKELNEQICPCCNKTVDNINNHLDECLAFFHNDATVPIESTSRATETIVIDDDDEFDESFTLNATGTKSPCPCCMRMIEQDDMNDHLDICLTS